MAIKPTGNTPIAPANDVKASSEVSASKASKSAESFSVDATSKVDQSAPVEAASMRAVTEVAAKISAGQIERGEPAFEAVIERTIEMQQPDLNGRALREEVADAQLLLIGDPMFERRISRMLDTALAAQATTAT